MVKFASVFAGLALVACSPSDASSASEQTAQSSQEQTAQDEPKTHPVSGLQIIDVTVEVDGKPITFASELAASPQEQQKGLMFRTELGDFDGMLFPYGSAAQLSFWMKNTPLELDIIFISPDRKVLNIGKGVPYQERPSVDSAGLAIGVLEIRGGRAAELGIEPGDAVSWDIP